MSNPYVPVLKRTPRYDFGLASVPLTAEELAAADATVIVTDHSCFDYELIMVASKLVVDTRNATRQVRNRAGEGCAGVGVSGKR